MNLTCVTAVFNSIKAGNRERLIRCVESVSKLKTEHEHLIYDGASTDGTVELLRELEKKTPGLKVVSEPDTGIYNALNKGVRDAKGEWFYVLGCDDYISSEVAFGKAIGEAERSNAEYLYGDVNMVDRDDRVQYVWRGTLSKLPFAQHYCHQSMVVRTDIIRRFGGFNLRYKVSADSDLMLRLYKEGFKAVYYAGAFACYRSGGMSFESWQLAQSDHAEAFHGYFGKDAGLSLEDCKSLWCCRGIGVLPYASCKDILTRLPEQDWRDAWEEKMYGAYSKDMIMYRLRRKFAETGFRGVLCSVVYRIRKHIGRCLKTGE